MNTKKIPKILILNILFSKYYKFELLEYLMQLVYLIVCYFKKNYYLPNFNLK